MKRGVQTYFVLTLVIIIKTQLFTPILFISTQHGLFFVYTSKVNIKRNWNNNCKNNKLFVIGDELMSIKNTLIRVSAALRICLLKR